MSPRTCLPLHADDLSSFAKSLRGQLADCGRVPGHVELLNMLARSGGFRNYQHLKAQTEAMDSLDSPAATPSVAIDYVQVKKLARYFDPSGRLIRWPSKYSHTGPCLWVLWARIEPRRDFTERQVNDILGAHHLFEDPALLRREMFDRRMLDRTPDCRVYRRIEQSPPDLALELLKQLRQRERDN